MPDNPISSVPPMGEIVLYQTEDGRTRVECRFADETLWLSQVLIAELFQKDVRTINEHLRNIYDGGEIDREATIRKFRIVRREGEREVTREVEHCNLDAIPAMWLDFAEDQARRRKQVFLKDWETRLNEFLRFNERAVLRDKGKVSKGDADARAETEYEEFAARRRTMLEAEAERAHQRALEEAASRLPEKPKRRKPKP